MENTPSWVDELYDVYYNFWLKDKCFRKVGVVESVGTVCKLDDRSAHALTLQNGTTGRCLLFFGGGPN